MPVQAATTQLTMSLRSASQPLSYCEENGDAMHYKPASCNRPEHDVQDDEAIKQPVLLAVTEQPELFLDAIAVSVGHVERVVVVGVGVSASSVSLVLFANRITRKILEKAYFSRNEAQRVA